MQRRARLGFRGLAVITLVDRHIASHCKQALDTFWVVGADPKDQQE